MNLGVDSVLIGTVNSHSSVPGELASEPQTRKEKGSVQPLLTLQGLYKHVRKKEPVSAAFFLCSSLLEGYGNSWASEMLLSTKLCNRT